MTRRLGIDCYVKVRLRLHVSFEVCVARACELLSYELKVNTEWNSISHLMCFPRRD